MHQNNGKPRVWKCVRNDRIQAGWGTHGGLAREKRDRK